MKMKKWMFLFLVFFYSHVACALVPLDSPEGKKMLISSMKNDYANPFFSEIRYFTHQQNIFFCGIASAVVVLNTLHLTPPQDPNFGPYRLFTQDNLFNVDNLKKLKITKEKVIGHGMTLSKEAQLLNAIPGVKAIAYSTKALTPSQTKLMLIKALSSDKNLVIVNILRSEMDETGGGHFSPVAAYDPKTEQVLFMDVASYRYGPTWIPLQTLYKAMRTMDGSSYRGFIIVSRLK